MKKVNMVGFSIRRGKSRALYLRRIWMLFTGITIIRKIVLSASSTGRASGWMMDFNRQ